MKMTFVVHNEHFTPEVMRLLKDAGIDYYTRWDHAQGKGHGTEPHLGTGSYASMNAILMIAFQDEAALAGLIEKIAAAIRVSPQDVSTFTIREVCSLVLSSHIKCLPAP